MAGEQDQHRQAGRAEQIAGEHQRPVAQQLAGGDLAIGPGHHQQVVAGEQFRPGHDHQHQPQREDDSANQLASGVTQRRIGLDQHMAECAGEHGQQQRGQPGQPRLGHADGLDPASDLVG